jgi:hypothetical protein
LTRLLKNYINLDLSPTINKIYRSGPQIVRVVTEE